jgi:hypothetical protein
MLDWAQMEPEPWWVQVNEATYSTFCKITRWRIHSEELATQTIPADMNWVPHETINLRVLWKADHWILSVFLGLVRRSAVIIRSSCRAVKCVVSLVGKSKLTCSTCYKNFRFVLNETHNPQTQQAWLKIAIQITIYWIWFRTFGES